MGDAIEQFSEGYEGNQGYDALMLRLERTLHSDFGTSFLEDVEIDSSWDQEISG